MTFGLIFESCFHDVSPFSALILDAVNYNSDCSYIYVCSGTVLRRELSVSCQVVSHVLLPLGFQSSLAVSWI